MNKATRPDDIFHWYAQFSHPEDKVDWANGKRNLFFKVSKTRIDKFEFEFGELLPTEYRRFLMEVGEGRFTRDIFGNTTDTYANVFAGPEAIADLLRNYDHMLKVNPVIFKVGDVPFFDIGSADYIVFDENKSTCKFSFLKDIVATSFSEFLMQLRENLTFYLEVQR